jgi:hypothetical protein
MKQPALGLVATALIIAISLGVISLFDFETFVGWASYGLMCLIPMEVVVGVAWGANPAFSARWPQPMKGILLMLVCVASAAIMVPAYLNLAGGGALLPNVILTTITSVIYMFTFAIMFGGWPFNVISKNQVVSGILLWAGVLTINFVMTRVFFNFGFLAGAPVYNAAFDPGGMFNAEASTVFHVTFICGLFLLLHFDLWPMTSMKQPNLGIVWTLLSLVIGGGLYYVGVNVMGLAPMAFLIRVPVPFIFGTIIVLNMMHNSIFAGLQQPVKGIANTAAAAVIGTALAMLYRAMAPIVTGNIAEGGPTSDFERWLASALLGVTFPFLIFYAEFFRMWPLTKPVEEKKAGGAAA